MRIYVGNLPYTATELQLREMFETFGKVHEVKIITDRETAQSRGFGFITMDTKDSATAAIAGLHQSDFGGRSLVVNEAKERSGGAPRSNGGGRNAYGWK